MGVMKRILSVFALAAFVSAAEGESFKSRFLQADFSYATERGIERSSPAFSAEFGMALGKGEFALGSQFSQDFLDFTARGFYFPRMKDSFEGGWKSAFGFGGTLHRQLQFGIAREDDFILDFVYRIQSERGFVLSLMLGGGLKSADVYAVSDDVGNLLDGSLELALDAGKRFACGAEAYFSWGCHSFYRYRLFFSPIYVFGIGYNFPGALRVSWETEVRITDQIITAPYVGSVIFRAAARYSF